MQFKLKTQGHTDFHNITGHIEQALEKTKLKNGLVTAFVAGTTCGMMIIDDEEGHRCDIRTALEKIAPEDGHYEHNSPGDMNGSAHVRCAIIGPSVSIPIVDGKTVLGTWQRVFVVDFDNRRRERIVTISIVG